MLKEFLQNPSLLIGPLGRTVVTIGVAYVIGLGLRDLVVVRLVRMASRSPGEWDDILVSEVRKRVPVWCLLLGAYFSVEYWPWPAAPPPPGLVDPWHGRVIGLIYGLTVASFTLAAASGLTRMISSYGTRAS